MVCITYLLFDGSGLLVTLFHKHSPWAFRGEEGRDRRPWLIQLGITMVIREFGYPPLRGKTNPKANGTDLRLFSLPNKALELARERTIL